MIVLFVELLSKNEYYQNDGGIKSQKGSCFCQRHKYVIQIAELIWQLEGLVFQAATAISEILYHGC
jgi:hypothetical protein